MLLLPLISITSHQNSSPTEVATVPLAIKIMLGHAMVVCDSTVGNKSSSSSRGNDADSWVVNLEQCRQKPLLWFLQETQSRPRLHVSVWTLLENIKPADGMEQHHLICVCLTAFYTQPHHWKACGRFKESAEMRTGTLKTHFDHFQGHFGAKRDYLFISNSCLDLKVGFIFLFTEVLYYSSTWTVQRMKT